MPEEVIVRVTVGAPDLRPVARVPPEQPQTQAVGFSGSSDARQATASHKNGVAQ